MTQGVVKRKWRAKKVGFGLILDVVRTLDDQHEVLVLREPSGRVHTFVEVEAKQAARLCGAPRDLTTKQAWNWVWATRRPRPQ